MKIIQQIRDRMIETAEAALFFPFFFIFHFKKKNI